MSEELGTNDEDGSDDDMRPRTRAREEALCALFMCDFHDNWSIELCDSHFDHFQVEARVAPYGKLLCSGVLKDIEVIQSLVSRASEHWSLTRMGRVDRCILYMSVFELARIRDLPINVVINEAVELAKRYGSENSHTFINGVLDRVAQIIEEEEKARCSSRTLESQSIDGKGPPHLLVSNSNVKMTG